MWGDSLPCPAAPRADRRGPSSPKTLRGCPVANSVGVQGKEGHPQGAREDTCTGECGVALGLYRETPNGGPHASRVLMCDQSVTV